MKKISWLTTIPVLVATLSSAPAQAATFSEGTEAGQLLSTAQVIPEGLQPLTQISGMLAGDADLFKIFLTGNQTFSATTISPETLIKLPDDLLLEIPVDTLIDPQLFLFDENGVGVYASDNSFGSAQSTLPSGPGGFSPTQSGFYYLGISGFDYDPVSTGGEIFPDPLLDEVVGPTGPGGNLPLNGFSGTSIIDPLQRNQNYTIFLSGVQSAAIPEPSAALGIWALGAWGAVAYRKNQRKRASRNTNVV